MLKPARRPQRPPEKAANGIYLPDHEREIQAIAMRGLSDQEIAQMYSIPYSLFKKWKKRYPSFKNAIEKGRMHADTEVLAALFKRATGKFSIPHTEIIKYKDDFETLELQKHFPPDTEACKYWLNNRAREHWQQRSAIEASGPGGKPIEVTTNRDQLLDAIVDLVKPQPDGEADQGLKRPSRPSGLKPKKAKKTA